MEIQYSKQAISPKTWESIEEIEPDDFDLQMLKEIENNPDCHKFVSLEETMKELNSSIIEYF